MNKRFTAYVSVILLLFLIGVAGAVECSNNIQIFTVDENILTCYRDPADSWTGTGQSYFEIRNLYNFPREIIGSASGGSSGSVSRGVFVQYTLKSKNCSYYYKVATSNFNMFGDVYYGNEHIGYFTLIHRDEYSAIYITYTKYPIITSYPFSLRFNIVNAIVFDPDFCSFDPPLRLGAYGKGATINPFDTTCSFTVYLSNSNQNLGIFTKNVTVKYQYAYDINVNLHYIFNKTLSGYDYFSNYTISLSGNPIDLIYHLYLNNLTFSTVISNTHNIYVRDFIDIIKIIANNTQHKLLEINTSDYLNCVNLEELEKAAMRSKKTIAITTKSTNLMTIPSRLIIPELDIDAILENGTYQFVLKSDKSTFNVTVYPFYNPVFARNITVNLLENPNIVIPNFYTYSVRVNVKYRDIIGNVFPVSFTAQANGSACPNKDEDCVSYAYQTAGYSSTRFILPAGNYTLTLKSSIAGLISKEKEIPLNLMDENYYRSISWTFGLTDDNITILTDKYAHLSVIVVDQNNKTVYNAKVRTVGTNYAKDDYTNVFGIAEFDQLEIGEIYSISVFYNNSIKAQQVVEIQDIYNTAFIQITLSEEEQRRNEQEKGEVNITVTTPISPSPPTAREIGNLVSSIIANGAFWGLVLVLILAGLLSSLGGERIGILAFIAGLGIFTFVIPLLPMAIFTVIAVIGFILFGWKVVSKITDGE